MFALVQIVLWRRVVFTFALCREHIVMTSSFRLPSHDGVLTSLPAMPRAPDASGLAAMALSALLAVPLARAGAVPITTTLPLICVHQHPGFDFPRIHVLGHTSKPKSF